MAHPDLSLPDLSFIPRAAAQAFIEGQEHRALTLLRRAQNTEPPASTNWARLERLSGLLLIHLLREVEGTFALERADARLEAEGVEFPQLEWLALKAQSCLGG